MFVPSLSWQNDRFWNKSGAQSTVFLPGGRWMLIRMGPSTVSTENSAGGVRLLLLNTSSWLCAAAVAETVL
jgi:hypothetical protein